VTFNISKEFMFSAAHRLAGLPPEHQCARLHGHNYIVRVVLAGDLNEVGFVRDYGDLDKFKQYLNEQWDHRYIGAGDLTTDDHYDEPEWKLIEAVFPGNPTAENLACAFYSWLKNNGYPEVVAVGVSETDKTWAWYAEEQDDDRPTPASE
jgi:6-pyruvoyltetrahydropterin/6-carboxytetrahydropterin synthase